MNGCKSLWIKASAKNYILKASTSSPLLPQASDYPVILSIENHCSVEQQRTMAQHLNHILGDALLRSPLEGKGLTGLPSPEVSGSGGIRWPRR